MKSTKRPNVLLFATWILAVGCVSQATLPPQLDANTPLSERREVFGKYRLQPLEDGAIVRGIDIYDVEQFREASEGCVQAERLLRSPAIWPHIVAGAGGAVAAVGLGRLLFTDVDDGLGMSESTAWTLVGVGAGVVVVTELLHLATRPAPTDNKAFAAAYNKCLQQQFDALPKPRPLDWRDAARDQASQDGAMRPPPATRTSTQSGR